MPHGELKSACEAMNQLAVEAMTACPAASPRDAGQRDAHAAAHDAVDSDH